MQKDICLSIIVPVYNVEQHIAACLDSIFLQEFDSYEVICVNDGSLDGSRKIITDYQKRFSKLKIIDKENSGLSAARNTGLRAASGEYVLFLDSDDTLAENCLSGIYNKAHNEKLDVLIGNTLFVNSYGEKGLIVSNSSDVIKCIVDGVTAYIELNRAKSYVPMAYNQICRREYLIDNAIFFKEGILHEDELWTPQALIKSNKANAYGKYHYNYFQRKNTITTSLISTRRIESLFIVAVDLIKFEKHFNIRKNIELKGWIYVRAFELYRNACEKLENSKLTNPIPKNFTLKYLLKEGLPFVYFEKCLRELRFSRKRKLIIKLLYLLLPYDGRKEIIKRYLNSFKNLITGRRNLK